MKPPSKFLFYFSCKHEVKISILSLQISRCITSDERRDKHSHVSGFTLLGVKFLLDSKTKKDLKKMKLLRRSNKNRGSWCKSGLGAVRSDNSRKILAEIIWQIDSGILAGLGPQRLAFTEWGCADSAQRTHSVPIIRCLRRAWEDHQAPTISCPQMFTQRWLKCHSDIRLEPFKEIL